MGARRRAHCRDGWGPPRRGSAMTSQRSDQSIATQCRHVRGAALNLSAHCTAAGTKLNTCPLTTGILMHARSRSKCVRAGACMLWRDKCFFTYTTNAPPLTCRDVCCHTSGAMPRHSQLTQQCPGAQINLRRFASACPIASINCCRFVEANHACCAVFRSPSACCSKYCAMNVKRAR